MIVYSPIEEAWPGKMCPGRAGCQGKLRSARRWWSSPTHATARYDDTIVEVGVTWLRRREMNVRCMQGLVTALLKPLWQPEMAMITLSQPN